VNFNSDSIELFLAVIDRGSFSAAARALGGASAVSMGIGNLEAELGYALFDRSHREPQPTAMALSLVPHARLIAEQLKQLQVHAVELSLGLESKLSIGVVADIDRRRLLAAIKVIAERHPLLDIEVLTAPQDDVLAMLHSGRQRVSGVCRVEHERAGALSVRRQRTDDRHAGGGQSVVAGAGSVSRRPGACAADLRRQS
jgi:DNA-binding transcriptional LysR family regulator